jgi:hypothetical protein
VVGLLPVVEVADAGDQRHMALLARPIDGLALRFESGQDVVGLVFNDLVVDRVAIGATLGTGFDIDIRHRSAPGGFSGKVTNWPLGRSAGGRA